ncbi:hypothetical protein D8M04_06390 [Oceanobacillus piezotolerans]|uniref:Leucine-binding protein domain-containing protein n=1 Tax=Oceanobacillus piezotolerans TaxID=2448030 RepID=A0A498D7Y8_9BACI|nr:ABC transporter substrate-binding protein [Oceanobacillus piezotolerans]RLL46825.1 hypothetical protein D8M04_06390 [Oceanobacillus piezotolerans]
MQLIQNTYKVLILILLLLFVSACAESESTSGNSEENKSTNGNAQGVTDDKIIVGTSAPQTGPVAIYDNVRKGIQSYIDYVNENGGVNGREIELIAYDDQYQPSKSLQNAQRLIEEDKVFALIGPIGTANINAAQSLLVESGIPVVGLNTGADKFVNPPIENFFATQFNYKIESKMLVDYAINKLNAKKVTLVYQNDDFGMDNLTYAKEALEEFPEVEIAAEVPFLASDTDFSSHTQKVLNSEPDAILMFSTPAPAAQLRKELYNMNATDIPFIVNTTGGADLNQFNVAGEEVWEGVITSTNVAIDESQVVDYDLYAERITSDYSEDTIGFLTAGGWSTGKIFVEALERAGDDLSWDNFINTMETFDGWEETFYPEVTYTPEHRYGMTTLYIVEAKDNDLSLLEQVYYNPDTEEVVYQ